jgi:hypothetical protein
MVCQVVSFFCFFRVGFVSVHFFLFTLIVFYIFQYTIHYWFVLIHYVFVLLLSLYVYSHFSWQSLLTFVLCILYIKLQTCYDTCLEMIGAAVYQWCEFKSRRGKTNIWQLKDLILTLFGLIFRRIYIYIYLYTS